MRAGDTADAADESTEHDARDDRAEQDRQLVTAGDTVTAAGQTVSLAPAADSTA